MRNVEVKSRKRVYDGFNKIDLLELAYDGGEKPVKREVVERGDAVAVLIHLIDQNELLFVRQLRAPMLRHEEPWLTEIVAGSIDEGETPEQAARREVGEEVGCQVRELRKLGEMYSSPGGLSEKLVLFAAEVSDDDKTGEGGGADEGEDVEEVRIPLAEAFAQLDRGELRDAKTQLAMHLYRRCSSF